jgi:CheY-like chemotaxis protein
MTNQAVRIVIAEDDDGHALLIERNLRRAGIGNELVRCADGQEVLDFFIGNGEPGREPDTPYLLLLDIRMPKVDGIDVLKRLKSDAELRKVPVIMLSTMDDPREVDRCHELGCSHYITKPVEYGEFVRILRQLGLFLVVVRVPRVR